MNLRSSLGNIVQRPTGYLSREWNRLAPRERNLVAVLGGAVLAAGVAVVAILAAQSLADIREENEGAREALAAIALHRDEFLEAKARMQAQEIRLGNDPPQLAADLEAAAREAGIQIPETSSKPAVPAGKRYLEHSVVVTLRQVDLLALSKFLSKVETGPRVIVINKLSIKQAFGEGEKLNVTLTATGWERINEARRKAAGAKEKT